MRIIGYISDTLRLIKGCQDLRDRFSVAMGMTGNGIIELINIVLHREAIANPYIFFARELLLKTNDGLFYCRKKTADYRMIRPRYEQPLRKYFDIDEGIFVDIGANIGRYSIMIARRLKNRGRVIAIEPEPGNFRMLLNNIKVNRLSNVIPLNVACNSNNGKVKLNMVLYNQGKIGSPSIMPDLETVNRDTHIEISVVARTLDSILQELSIEEVKLVKIDVEGAEMKVLRGAIQTIEKSKNLRIILEDRNRQTVNFLTEQGFKVNFLKQLSEYWIAERPKE
jgi:FkbM family methyltransferase